MADIFTKVLLRITFEHLHGKLSQGPSSLREADKDSSKSDKGSSSKSAYTYPAVRGKQETVTYKRK